MTAAELIVGLRLPVLAAPMFLVSGIDLVLAQSRAGIIGSFPALNARPQAMLADWLGQLGEALGPDKLPYAVNLIAHSSNPRYAQDLAVCAQHKVPLLLTSLQEPHEAVSAARGYGGLVFHDVTTIRHAEKAIEQGVDGLILVCNGAGGHAGTINPFVFVTEVRRFYSGPLVLAGGMTRGADILAARILGADLVYMGTRFIATHESQAVDAYKQMVTRAGSKDIIYTPSVSGIPGNYLRESMTALGLDPDNLPPPERSGQRRERPAAWRDIWGAGQAVGGVDAITSVAECVDQLLAEYAEARTRIAGQKA